MAAYFLISVTNQGGYVAKASVTYTEDGQENTQHSGNFTAGAKKTFQIPSDATSIILDVEDEYFINMWRNIFDQQWQTAPAEPACFEVAGTTVDPSWKTVNC